MVVNLQIIQIKLQYGWDEMIRYLLEWKESEDNVIELNFEEDWETTKQELLDLVPKKIGKRLKKK